MLIYVSAYPIFLLIAQAVSDRLIVSERTLEQTKNLLKRERSKGLSIQEALEVNTRSVEDMTLIEPTMYVASALCFLTRVLGAWGQWSFGYDTGFFSSCFGEMCQARFG